MGFKSQIDAGKDSLTHALKTYAQDILKEEKGCVLIICCPLSDRDDIVDECEEFFEKERYTTLTSVISYCTGKIAGFDVNLLFSSEAKVVDVKVLPKHFIEDATIMSLTSIVYDDLMVREQFTKEDQGK